MPLLVEFYKSEAGMQFVNDDGFGFVSDGEFVFNDKIGVLRLSDEKFNGYRAWNDDILGIDPIAFRMDQAYGGMVKISGAGTIEISMKVFHDAGPDWWFPAETYGCRISYATDLEDSAIILLEGTVYQSEINPPLSVTYTLYADNYGINLLQDATDYDGNAVVLPMAFGRVSFVTPTRISDEPGTGYRRYKAGGIVGTKHIDWHIFDDGIDVCSNAIDHLSDLDEIYYTVTPVGNITISGSGINVSGVGCWDVFNHLCQATWLDKPMTTYAPALNAPVDRWQTEQILVVDFLSLVAAATENFFYILQGSLYLHRLNTADYGVVDMDVSNDTLEGTKYQRITPNSIAKYTYKTRKSVSESIGQYVKEFDVNVSAVSAYPFGSEITVDAMTETFLTATLRLSVALSYLVALRGSLSLPLSSALLRPGTQFLLADRRYTGSVLTSTTFYLRDIVYDFISKKMTVEGEITTMVVT